MGAAASILSFPAKIFGAGVAVGIRVGLALAAIRNAAEAVMSYVRTAKEAAAAFVKAACDKAAAAMDYVRRVAASAWEKLKAAAAFVRDEVMKLVRHVWGDNEAAAAGREFNDAARDAGHDVLSRASARAPPSSAIVSATPIGAGGGALALHGYAAAAPAARAAHRASEMMALLEAERAVLSGSIPRDAWSCIWVVVSAVGIGLEAIAADAAKDA